MERSNTFTLPQLTHSQRVGLGNNIAIICFIVVIAQFYFQDLPLYVYAIELAFPIFIIGYHITKKLDERNKSHAKSAIKDSLDKVGLSRKERKPIDKKIAKNDIAAAWEELSKIIDQKKSEINERAREARCFAVILHYFESGGTNLIEAEGLIESALDVREDARINGIEKEVIADLESGYLEEARKKVSEAKSKVSKAADEKYKEDRGKDFLSILEKKINKLEDANKKKELQKKLRKLEKLDYGTKTFNIARRDLSNHVLREETAQLQGVW